MAEAAGAYCSHQVDVLEVVAEMVGMVGTAAAGVATGAGCEARVVALAPLQAA